MFYNLLLSAATFLGVTFSAAGTTPAQSSKISSLPSREEQVINLETATVDEYGFVDIGVNDFDETGVLPLTGGMGCELYPQTKKHIPMLSE